MRQRFTGGISKGEVIEEEVERKTRLETTSHQCVDRQSTTALTSNSRSIQVSEVCQCIRLITRGDGEMYCLTHSEPISGPGGKTP